MLLNQLVRINEAGIVADSVNFSLMEQPETNQKLCEGFVFNYDKDKPEESTVGVLEALRSSYDSRSHANVHLLVQQYGKGKSHFAVAIANYFSTSADSPEVQGILTAIENAAGRNSPIAQRLQSYKKYGRHLVVCLSGDRAGDIRKQFLQSLLKALAAEGITDSIAQHICSEPLNYLQGLYANPRERERAEAYLESIGSPDGDLDSITQQLRKSNSAVISTLKDLAKHLVGFVPDWNINIDLEEILKDLITTHCSGENPRFQGVLILFDELNFYLQNWAKDPIGAGGTALQNITNICEAYKSKIALLSFTQIDPAMGVGIPAGSLDDHKRLVSRLAPKGSTYTKVASSLELVLDNLLIQEKDTPAWDSFCTTWNNTLLAETNNAYEKRTTSYRQKGWSRNDFHQILTIGCFPLHPLTAYLLCNLSFTVDRTALQFIKKEVKAFIQNQPLTLEQADSRLNFIYPIALVDTFLENFANDSNYSKYKEAYSAVAGSDDPHEALVLKALFLYHASSGRLTKDDRESHEEVLATLTGLSALAIKAALNKLMTTRDVIYYKPEVKLYRFWAGIAPTGIEKEIENEIREKKEEASIEQVAAYCRTQIESFLGSRTLAAKHFVDQNKLVAEDWKFEYKVYTIDSFSRALSSDQTLRSTEEQGILAFVVAETQADLQDFRRRIDALLANSPIRARIAVAIPSDETGELATALLKIKTLKNKEVAERRGLGQAYDELLNRWQEQVSTQASNLLKSCTYHCVGVERIPPQEREPQRVISVLLENLYPFVPPIEGVDKLRANHVVGRKVVSFVARQLLADNLTAPLPDNTYGFVDSVFVTRWKLLKKTSRTYTAQVPENERLRAAWDLISTMADLGEQSEKIIDLQKIWKALSAPPYGYSEYNFTMLLAGWLSYHRKEVSLKGNATILAAGRRGSASVTVETKSLKDWSQTNILEKPDEFVKKWIVTGNAKLIRRKKVLPPTQPQSPLNHSQAEQYLLAVETYLETGEPDPTEIGSVTKTRDQVYAGFTRISEWFQPVEVAERLAEAEPLATILEIYPKLLSAPPALVLRDDIISVQPTLQQRDRQAQTLQAVSEKIEQLIDAQSERSESVSTEEACGAYKGEVQRLLAQLTQVSSLPPHLTDTLRYSLQTADRRLLELKEAAKVRDCLSQIHNRYMSLGNSPTQQDYLLTREAIEALARATPTVKQDETYEQTLLDLNQAYNALAQQVEIWEEQSIGLVSPEQIHALKGEINGRQYRFTEESSKQKIVKLLEYLDRELSVGRNRDEAVKAIKATLSTANRKLERIRDVASNRLPEAFQSYQELIETRLAAVDSTIDIEEYQQELEGFKVKGRSALISEGFAKIYSLELRRLEDYTRLKTRLQQLLDFIAGHEEFTDVKANLEQALQTLEIRQIELQAIQQEQQRKSDDDKIIRFIRSKYRLPATNTIQSLENGIKEIQNYQSKLYEPEPVASEIEQIVQTLQDRIVNQIRTLNGLRDRLHSIVALKDLEQVQTEYARLEFAFKDSSEYVDYQLLQQQFQPLRDDLEKLQVLEALSQQSYSISSCHKALSTIHSEQITLNHLDRFRQKLAELEGNLQHKVQTYTQELDDFEHRSKHLVSAKEAQMLHEELLKQSARYAQSESSDRYEALSTNIRLLIELLQISEAESKTLEACQSQREKLAQWKGNIDVLDPLLQERFDSIRAATEQTEARLLQRQQGEVERWLTALENQAAEFDRLTDVSDKGKLANKLLQKIEREQDQRAEALSVTQQEALKAIQRQCEAEIAKDCENQIKVLFERIPRPRRVGFYRELEALLSDPTEEFNG
ncbi:hypothetical protein C7B82_07770 [Stenomitos frigidus ULC18]|uniref:Uncharacterized protein n=2 Tax=Stenomitos TaxID=1844270 RepID=A0A2T1EE82_9CYAN|nr:hypothetical protein C7B82_07770 [Stenomitos frigidus ULC18]